MKINLGINSRPFEIPGGEVYAKIINYSNNTSSLVGKEIYDPIEEIIFRKICREVCWVILGYDRPKL